MSSQDSPLRIFLSSTAIDMVEHRKKASDAILRLNHMPVGMEHFGANPKPPVDLCKSKVVGCDVLVVMVAHRYGWVPSKEDGGDGKKSITWIEVEAALENKIPVLAFIIDDNQEWMQPTEQDQLKTAKDQKDALLIFDRVQSLIEFKTFLNSKAGLTRDIFTSSDNLDSKVTSSLADWILNQKPSNRIDPKIIPFTFRTVHPLQPAPHFKGRKQLLAELDQWWKEPVTPDRVRSLVAIGGTGKTAVVERFLNSIDKSNLRGSVLVWSFYDDPNTDAFLNEACLVFTGEKAEGAGGKLEKLQRALTSDSNQHLIVLDGLERVQSEGKDGSGYAKGVLEDHRLKNLLRSIANGLGNTRSLITTRFKLADLSEWESAGYKSHELDILDKETAIEVLTAWEIKGDDKQLVHIAESVGRHALSVSVLGSYLNHYCNCNSEGIKEFKLDEITSEDPLAARLGRVLGGYAKNLPDQQRDLIVRLSVFPKGVSVDILVYLIDAGGEMAGTLIGLNKTKLLLVAEKLKQQGLIYSYKNENTIMYTVHPFLRDYFRDLLGVKSEDVHEVVRNKLAIGLNTKPKNKPTESALLDKYEKLIEHSILAGHQREALDLYGNIMGGSGGDLHLFHIVGDYGRIIRIISLFSEDGNPQTFTNQLSDYDKAFYLNEWGLAAIGLGNLKTADFCFSLSYEINQKNNLKNNTGQCLQNSAWVNMLRGLFTSAKKILEESLQYIDVADKEDVEYLKKYTHAYLGYTLYSLGEISLSKQNFFMSRGAKGDPLYSYCGIYEADFNLAIGEKQSAIDHVKENILVAENRSFSRDVNLFYYILGILSLPDSIPEARGHLQKLREWTEKSGYMDCIIRSHILASEIAYHSNDYPAAISEATTGLNHSEGCGFGKHTIDLNLLLSKIHLAIPDYKTALSLARKALDLSANPECGYAWGEANGLHLCGVCHKGLGEYELARMRLEPALKLREKIEHPDAAETRKLLAELPQR